MPCNAATVRPNARLTRALDVGARVLAAAGGGYLIAALCTALLPRALPLTRDQGVTAATLLSFAIYAGVVLWVFAANSMWRVWAWLVGIAATLGVITWIVLAFGGRL